MFTKTLSLMFFIATLAGCASTYKPNQTSLDLQRTLDRASAEKILADSLATNDHSTGICATLGMLATDAKTRATLSNNTIVIKDGYEKGEMIRYTKEFTEYKKRYLDREIPLSKITKIRIQLEGDTHFCGQAKGENKFQAFISAFEWFVFDVRNEDMDKVIASIKILAPNTELITGMGF